jgi:hypothetical protein
MVKYEIMFWPFHLEYFYGDWNSVGFGKPHCFSARSHLSDFDNWINVVTGGKISGLGGAVEVDEAEDYKAPGSNPGQELWNMNMCFPIIFMALRDPEPTPTPSSDIRERHILVTWYQNRVVVEPQRRTADVVGSWCRRRNISS